MQDPLRQKNIALGNGPVKLIAINSRYIHSCLALFYLRNCLEQNGVCRDPEIFQATINDNYYETLLRIGSGKPRVVFFSANIWNSGRIERLVRDLHRSLVNCVFIIGGPQAVVLRSKLADSVCTVVIGEIEVVPEEFYEDLARGKLKPLYRPAPGRKRIKQLAFPFRDDDFRDHLKNRYIYYETSRGCPHGCSYCQSASEKGLFHKDREQVEQELTRLLHYKPKVVRFVDRTFNDLPERSLGIWQFLAAQKSETLFHFEIAPDRFTEEMFTFLEGVESGRFQFEIGIQTTHDKTLQAINRSMDLHHVHDIIARLVSLETIHLHVDLILGLPYETGETFADSFRHVFAMGAHYVQMGLLKILPNTPLSEQVGEFGYKYCEAPPYSVLENKWLTHAEMSELYWFCECVEKFHNNRYFVSLWAYLRKVDEDIYLFFNELLGVCRGEMFFERAPTQAFLTDLLMVYCKDRDDYETVADLLRYDWLRCGFRKLPPSLVVGAGEEGSDETRNILYSGLPENLNGVFTSRERNNFFKKSVFLQLKDNTCKILGIECCGTGRRIGVLTEREESLYRHNKVVVLPDIVANIGVCEQ
ncbi:B12-binding domain-containing radical SAM protein [Desulfopila sp. IMCC35008]|uniref:B12-binding domain-containing radical SAM protein n=1 Tax=Desulfopila sp. IMCC35008 TaxID=2653858 RepID=UPI0013D6190D|nr:radical SAM protein [Desulfopila sp. IMCC35008]